MFRIRNPNHRCNRFEQSRWDKAKKKWPFLPVVLIVLHFCMHELPMIAIGSWVAIDHCHHHEEE